jgi:hypothetical protein
MIGMAVPLVARRRIAPTKQENGRKGRAYLIQLATKLHEQVTQQAARSEDRTACWLS